MEPPRRGVEIGVIPTSRLTQRRRGVCPDTILHPTLPTPCQTPHLTHIDEDALEGVYFAFLTILRCLPYFLRKTRPRASYGLLEAFSPSLGLCGSSWVGVGLTHPPSHTPHPMPNTPSHPHRRGCPRRGLFRVLDHPKVFALLFAKNAS